MCFEAQRTCGQEPREWCAVFRKPVARESSHLGGPVDKLEGKPSLTWPDMSTAGGRTIQPLCPIGQLGASRARSLLRSKDYLPTCTPGGSSRDVVRLSLAFGAVSSEVVCVGAAAHVTNSWTR